MMGKNFDCFPGYLEELERWREFERRYKRNEEQERRKRMEAAFRSFGSKETGPVINIKARPKHSGL